MMNKQCIVDEQEVLCDYKDPYIRCQTVFELPVTHLPLLTSNTGKNIGKMAAIASAARTLTVDITVSLPY